MVPWYRCGGCFLVLTIFMASSETWQTEWEVEVCVEAQCHWGGQSTEDSTKLSSPPLQPLLPQRVRLSKLFCLSLWWRCHLETDLVPHFLILYLEIIAYLQGCGKNSTESLIQFPPSFPMVAAWTTPLQLKKKQNSKLTWNKNVSYSWLFSPQSSCSFNALIAFDCGVFSTTPHSCIAVLNLYLAGLDAYKKHCLNYSIECLFIEVCLKSSNA